MHFVDSLVPFGYNISQKGGIFLIFGYRSILPGTGHQQGRALLSALWSAHRPDPMPPILTGPRGKPYFQGNPLYFSISHTPRHVFCVLSDRPVGLDAEEEDRSVDLRLSGKILSPGELREFSQAANPRQALLSFWVLKEASAKCSGEGLRGYPNHTDFSLSDPRLFREAGCIIAIIQEEQHAL